MTGVGLGAALPNLIALTSEAAGPRFRGTAVSLMYCGVPIGAALAATLGFAGANLAWQTVFWVGGVVPLILVPLLMRWLPESTVSLAKNRLRHHCVRYLRQKRQPRRCCCGCVIFHSAGGLHVDQLAAAAFGGARIPAIAGGRGDVCTANGGGKRDVNVGRIDG